MDKKSIIGLVLIFGIFIGYMWWVSPSKEELAKMQAQHDSMVAAYQDSIYQDSVLKAEAEVLKQHLRDSIAAVNPEALADFDAEVSGMIGRVEKQNKLAEFGFNVAATTDTMTVKNGVFDVQLLNQGAEVNQVVLTQHQTFDSMPLVLISPNEDNMNMVFPTMSNGVVNTKDMHFTTFVNGNQVEGNQEIELDKDSLVISYRAYAQSMDTLSVELTDGKDQYLEYEYTFYPKSYQVGFKVNFHGLKDIINANQGFVDFMWQNQMSRQEKVDPTARGKANPNKDREKFYSNVYWKPIGDKVDNLKTARDDQKQINTQVEWVGYKQQFFCAVLSCDKNFENVVLANQTNREKDTMKSYLCDMKSTIGLTYDADKDCSVDMQFYFGPSKFRDLKAINKDFTKMLPLGDFFLINWTSRLLIFSLNLFENFNWNYGIILIVITFLLRCVFLFPLTYPSYKGSAIMRVLRPEMEMLNKKYPDQSQALQKQQAMTQLQRSAGYNPMAGCLPALIQLPILWAMFRFIPTSVELRQKPFLWCDDLSNYDSILDFGFNVPFYGDHMSLFCILMFGMQMLQMWYSMKGTPQQANMPGMKFMMYFMPFMMLFMLNSQSAALNLYYGFSLVCSLVMMVLIRKFTSEKKIRARMAAYQLKQQSKKNSGKKSKWAARLEQMQKMAEAQQKAAQQQRR